MHTRRGHVGTDDKLVPRQVEALSFFSNLSLFSDIFRNNCVDLADEDQTNESLERPLKDTAVLNAENADDDASIASGSDDEEHDEFILQSQEQEAFGNFDVDVLSKKHRLQILEQNTARWSTLSFPLLLCQIYSQLD